MKTTSKKNPKKKKKTEKKSINITCTRCGNAFSPLIFIIDGSSFRVCQLYPENKSNGIREFYLHSLL